MMLQSQPSKTLYMRKDIFENLPVTILKSCATLYAGILLEVAMAMPAVNPQPAVFPLSAAIRDHHLVDEETLLRRYLLHPGARLPNGLDAAPLTESFIQAIRHAPASIRIESLLKEYSLNTQEGITLMCLAEALLRIPDDYTAERFLQDRLHRGDWAQHVGHSDTFWVNASTWGLLLVGKLFQRTALPAVEGLSATLSQLFHKISEPLALGAIRQAMAIIGHQFVAGETITEALAQARKETGKGYGHSFDMLGEAALTHDDVQHYRAAYESALLALAGQNRSHRPDATLSIKLSAFHPRFEPRQPSALIELKKNLLPLLEKARAEDIAITIDAEESWRLEASLELFAEILSMPAFRQWGKLGLAVQAYQKRALPVLHWLGELSRQLHCSIPVRLVKGAYWDSEIKWAQQHGLSEYPVFTRKASTDLSYQLCARYLLGEDHLLQPQFATHNAQSVAIVMTLAQHFQRKNFEFQRLHGMGEALYDHVLAHHHDHHCRIYAPVGNFRELLPYLVRRLLENGANTSFVRQVHQGDESHGSLGVPPAVQLRHYKTLRHSKIPVPPKLFHPQRKNSAGLAIEERHTQLHLQNNLNPWLQHRWNVDNDNGVVSPTNADDLVGCFPTIDEPACQKAIAVAHAALQGWRHHDIKARAQSVENIGDLFEQHRPELLALLMRESGKTLPNAIGEIREAVDFCRYYAAQARTTLTPQCLPGPTGESNTLYTEGRGVFLCISPWNFPLAILTGQIVAALVAGNTVLAKCSQVTPLIAQRAIELMHAAGIPRDVLHYLPAGAAQVEATLLPHPQLGGVMFTGSNAVAQRLQRTLARRDGPILPLIAETGGMNAMIVDSSALPEQVVKDVALSAFDSAGQRCSALRILFLQNDIADHVLALLKGHLETLRTGDPSHFATDIGPVINGGAKRSLLAHIEDFRARGQFLFQAPLAESHPHGQFVAPTVLSLQHMNELQEEVFGPVLHVIRYDAERLDDVIEQISNCGYGLTFGVHTRIEGTWQRLAREIPAGNIYINRNMIGATVGVQPFGGQGLSGTGPKAGGPHYLLRLVNEKTVTHNTSAVGGNTQLLTGEEE